MRLLIAIGILVALSTGGAAAGTITPTASDRQAFQDGVRAQQAINIFADPRGCGIVLMRPYCRAAFIALLGDLSRVPGLEKFAETGNMDVSDKGWADANVVGFTDAQWTQKPRETWLRAAGVTYGAYYVPDWDAYATMQVLVFRQLVRFASGATPYDTLLSASDLQAGPSAVDIQGPKRIAKYLVPALGQVFVPEAEPAVHVTSGALGDAQLGVYASTAQEMFESPVLFLAPSSRAFLSAVCSQLGDAKLGEQFISASNPDEWKAAIQQFQSLEETKLKSLPEKPKEAFLFGMFSAQAAYNAAVLREKPAREQHLAILRQTAAAVPSSVSSEVKAVLAAGDDWHALNAAATALTLKIVTQ